MVKLLLLFLLFALSGCHYVNHKLHLKDDNIIEEFIEFEIQKKTGLEIDLTPTTNERMNLA